MKQTPILQPMKKILVLFGILLVIYGASCSTNGYYPKTRKFYIKGRTIDTLGNPVPNLVLYFGKIRSISFTGTEILDSLTFKTDAKGEFLFSRAYEHKIFQDNNCNAYYVSPRLYSLKTAPTYSVKGECNGDTIIFRHLIFIPK